MHVSRGHVFGGIGALWRRKSVWLGAHRFSPGRSRESAATARFLRARFRAPFRSSPTEVCGARGRESAATAIFSACLFGGLLGASWPASGASAGAAWRPFWVPEGGNPTASPKLSFSLMQTSCFRRQLSGCQDASGRPSGAQKGRRLGPACGPAWGLVCGGDFPPLKTALLEHRKRKFRAGCVVPPFRHPKEPPPAAAALAPG